MEPPPPGPSPTISDTSSKSPGSMMEASGPLFSPPLMKALCSQATPNALNDSDDDVDLLRDAMLLARRKIERERQQPPLSCPLKPGSLKRRKDVDATTLASPADSESDSDCDLLRDVLLLNEKRKADSKYLLAGIQCQENEAEKNVVNTHDSIEPPPPFASLEEETSAIGESTPRTPQTHPVVNDSLWSDSEGEIPKPAEKSAKKRKEGNLKSSRASDTVAKKSPRLPARRPIPRATSEASFSDEGKGNESDDNISIEKLMPDFDNPKLGPPSDLEPLILKYAGGERIVPAAFNRYLKGYQREGVVFMHNRISMNKGVIL